MDSRTIDAFKSKLVGGGARPNLFEVELQWPDFLTSLQLTFLSEDEI